MTEDERLAIIEKSAIMLMEHFDSVQIFAARANDDGDVEHYNLGKGSWFERFGVVRAWMLREEQELRTGPSPRSGTD